MKTKTQFTQKLPGGLSFDMIYVEGGSFMMGSEGEGAYNAEKPVHKVAVPSFFLGKFPVTQELWQAIMGSNPAKYKGEEHPVEKVSWYDSKKFIEKLNVQTKKSYRLPSEAEWEYAARGGIYSEGFLYAGSDRLTEVGWYEDNNTPRGTKAVGRLLGNELGLFDMSGNVYEWCEDDWHEHYRNAPLDGSAWINRPKRAERRVLRGGRWSVNARYCRVSNRSHVEPGARIRYVGFRLVLPRV